MVDIPRNPSATFLACVIYAKISRPRGILAFECFDRPALCAILATLPPGGYTAQVSGVDGTTGVALVEVYEVP
ncbi:MAG TPA: hypothetical protein VHO24_09950 [Opitutaceae bacterium]|nr:hypothetical protein [Opitutaceae bacterium]